MKDIAVYQNEESNFNSLDVEIEWNAIEIVEYISKYCDFEVERMSQLIGNLQNKFGKEMI